MLEKRVGMVYEISQSLATNHMRCYTLPTHVGADHQ
jgi:hypothetical protein